jgi:hypothetical protein
MPSLRPGLSSVALICFSGSVAIAVEQAVFLQPWPPKPGADALSDDGALELGERARY